MRVIGLEVHLQVLALFSVTHGLSHIQLCKYIFHHSIIQSKVKIAVIVHDITCK